MGLRAPHNLLPPFLVCCYTHSSCWKDRSHWKSLGIQLLARVSEFFIEPVRLLLEAAWIPHWSGETAPQTVLPARFASVNSVYCETVAGEWILRGVIKSLTSEATRNILLCKTVCFRVCNLFYVYNGGDSVPSSCDWEVRQWKKVIATKIEKYSMFCARCQSSCQGKKLMWKFLNFIKQIYILYRLIWVLTKKPLLTKSAFSRSAWMPKHWSSGEPRIHERLTMRDVTQR